MKNMHSLMGISFFFSGIAFLVSIFQLIQIEGPGSPDLSYTLSGPNGRGEFTIMLFIFAIAVITCTVGMSCLYMQIKESYPVPALISILFTTIAAAAFLSLLTFHYTLVSLVNEGLDTNGSQFHFFAVLSHSAGDFSGWISIALYAISMFIVSAVLHYQHKWKIVQYAGFVFFIILFILYFLSASYAFLILFALWEILLSLYAFRSNKSSA